MASCAYGLLPAIKNGLLKTICSLLNCIIAFIISDLLMVPIRTIISKYVGPFIVAIIPNVSGFVASNYVLEEIVKQLPAIILIPSLFVTFYFVFFAILDAISGSVIKANTKKASKMPLSFKCSSLVAAVISIPITFLGFWVVLVPVTGFIDMAAPASASLNSMVSAEENDTLSTIDEIVEKVEASKLFNVARKLGTTDKFNKLTSMKIGEDNIDLGAEMETVAKITEKLAEITSGDDGVIKSETIKEIVLLLSDSKLASMAVAEEIKNASADWLKGEEHYGITLLNGKDEDYDEMMGSVLKAMSGAEPEDMPDVFNFIAEVIDVIPNLGGEEEQTEAKNLLAELDADAIANLLLTAHDSELLAKTADSMLRYLFTKVSDAIDVNIDEEIEKISISSASREDAESCAANVKTIIKEAQTYSDKLFTDPGSLSEEESNHLKDVLESCKQDKIFGDVAGKLVSGYEEKQKEKVNDIAE